MFCVRGFQTSRHYIRDSPSCESRAGRRRERGITHPSFLELERRLWGNLIVDLPLLTGVSDEHDGFCRSSCDVYSCLFSTKVKPAFNWRDWSKLAIPRLTTRASPGLGFPSLGNICAMGLTGSREARATVCQGLGYPLSHRRRKAAGQTTTWLYPNPLAYLRTDEDPEPPF